MMYDPTPQTETTNVNYTYSDSPKSFWEIDPSQVEKFIILAQKYGIMNPNVFQQFLYKMKQAQDLDRQNMLKTAAAYSDLMRQHAKNVAGDALAQAEQIHTKNMSDYNNYLRMLDNVIRTGAAYELYIGKQFPYQLYSRPSEIPTGYPAYLAQAQVGDSVAAQKGLLSEMGEDNPNQFIMAGAKQKQPGQVKTGVQTSKVKTPSNAQQQQKQQEDSLIQMQPYTGRFATKRRVTTPVKQVGETYITESREESPVERIYNERFYQIGATTKALGNEAKKFGIYKEVSPLLDIMTPKFGTEDPNKENTWGFYASVGPRRQRVFVSVDNKKAFDDYIKVASSARDKVLQQIQDRMRVIDGLLAKDPKNTKLLEEKNRLALALKWLIYREDVIDAVVKQGNSPFFGGYVSK